MVVIISGPPQCGKTTMAEVVQMAAEGMGKSVEVLQAEPDCDIDILTERIQGIHDMLGPDVVIVEGVSLC